jgi:predicted ribonuclease YlaK
VRKKAQGLVRQIKGYRRRGRLTEGVPLVRGVSEVVGIATEPNMSQALPWLVATNADDRFLASTLKIMRQRPQSPVTVVTADVNMQNKAEYARISFVEPPDSES